MKNKTLLNKIKWIKAVLITYLGLQLGFRKVLSSYKKIWC